MQWVGGSIDYHTCVQCMLSWYDCCNNWKYFMFTRSRFERIIEWQRIVKTKKRKKKKKYEKSEREWIPFSIMYYKLISILQFVLYFILVKRKKMVKKSRFSFKAPLVAAYMCVCNGFSFIWLQSKSDSQWSEQHPQTEKSQVKQRYTKIYIIFVQFDRM